jgi:hypothetical protein
MEQRQVDAVCSMIWAKRAHEDGSNATIDMGESVRYRCK